MEKYWRKFVFLDERATHHLNSAGLLSMMATRHERLTVKPVDAVMERSGSQNNDSFLSKKIIFFIFAHDFKLI